MKVRITIDVNDGLRRAIARYYGGEGEASREQVSGYLLAAVDGALETVIDECGDEDLAEAEDEDGR